MGADVDGGCAGADLSARGAVRVAVATRVDMMLAKPGIGVDEAISTVGDQQSRLPATLGYQRSRRFPKTRMAASL